ncbi:hypothetical protein HID58_000769 [Brassica napus]|uniref:Uncharacterized protein n=1 Tax=Brassica napus TaxID=3708 RepID=A0ABQ8EHH0_BRANA|nr:hypothetical protein HID58_000769 [Brassica napus]
MKYFAGFGQKQRLLNQ